MSTPRHALVASPSIPEFVANLTFCELPDDVRMLGKMLLLDTLACLSEGAKVEKAASIQKLSTQFGGVRKALMYGLDYPVPLGQAAYANARLANLLDFDETYPTGVHFGIAAVVAALCGAEAISAKPADLLLAIICGYEAGARIASSIGTMATLQGDGLRYAPTWGVAAPVVVAAGVAYAKILNLSSAQLNQALGISVTNIPLPIGRKWSSSTALPDVKYDDAGWCTIAGIHGVEAVLCGTTGYDDLLDEPAAFLDANGSISPRAHLLTQGLGNEWLMREISFKPWPCCRFMHTALSALSEQIRTSFIEEQRVRFVNLLVNSLSCGRRFMNSRPQTFIDYQFSYPHAAAMLIMGVPPGASWFAPEYRSGNRIDHFRDLVNVSPLPSDPAALFGEYGHIRSLPAQVDIELTNGERLRGSAMQAAGDPWCANTAFSFADVVAKFNGVTGDRPCSSLPEWCATIEKAPNLLPLFQFLTNGLVQSPHE